MKPAIIIACILFAVARPFMPTHAVSPAGSYEAAAHLLVGFLIGGFTMTRARWKCAPEYAEWMLTAVVLLSVVEVGCAAAAFINK